MEELTDSLESICEDCMLGIYVENCRNCLLNNLLQKCKKEKKAE